tara:strand:- start:5536 stop:6603 length:1068 start_codon:yes stop_codon:yes gene_type:complete
MATTNSDGVRGSLDSYVSAEPDNTNVSLDPGFDERMTRSIQRAIDAMDAGGTQINGAPAESVNYGRGAFAGTNEEVMAALERDEQAENKRRKDPSLQMAHIKNMTGTGTINDRSRPFSKWERRNVIEALDESHREGTPVKGSRSSAAWGSYPATVYVDKDGNTVRQTGLSEAASQARTQANEMIDRYNAAVGNFDKARGGAATEKPNGMRGYAEAPDDSLGSQGPAKPNDSVNEKTLQEYHNDVIRTRKRGVDKNDPEKFNTMLLSTVQLFDDGKEYIIPMYDHETQREVVFKDSQGKLTEEAEKWLGKWSEEARKGNLVPYNTPEEAHDAMKLMRDRILAQTPAYNEDSRKWSH